MNYLAFFLFLAAWRLFHNVYTGCIFFLIRLLVAVTAAAGQHGSGRLAVVEMVVVSITERRREDKCFSVALEADRQAYSNGVHGVAKRYHQPSILGGKKEEQGIKKGQESRVTGRGEATRWVFF